MAKDLGSKVSHVFESENYNFNQVVFNKGRPPLDAELNLLQEVRDQVSRKTTLNMASGWLSYRKPFTSNSSDLVNSFYTQDETGAIPEVALVNGWPVVVTDSFTDKTWVNKVDLGEFPLLKGSRVDGVFLEVWRGLISDEVEGITTPTDASLVSKLNATYAVSAAVSWGVGDNGVIVKTDNGGTTWVSQKTPTAVNLHDVKFVSSTVGYIVGDSGVMFRTDNAGVSWSSVSLGVTDSLKSIATFGDSSVWVCGNNGTILRSTDGVVFSVILNTNQTDSNFNSIYFNDTLVGWVCGDGGSYLRTQDGGQSWTRITIFVTDSLGAEVAVSANLNSLKFVNLNDGWIVGDSGTILRTTDGGLRWGDTSTNVYDSTAAAYTSVTENLNKVEVYRELPLKVTTVLADASFFKAATYTLTATQLVMGYVRRSDDASFSATIDLGNYATDELLVAAINALRSEENRKIFTATLGFTETAYTAHDNTGSIVDSESMDIKFSLGDRAWITGNRGTVLSSTNSGAQWLIEDVGSFFDIIGASFFDEQIGWVVGDQGVIVSHDSDRPATAEEPTSPKWLIQESDLINKTVKKVYFEGNANAVDSKNLNNNSIHPDVRVETATRTQLQYRIRVIEGVDTVNYQEAGLGAPYVFSRGPNGSVRDAGSYAFENMGSESGDYGLWRSRCRNTVDGYTYAVPMFLVSRRNLEPFDSASNINGSTAEDLNIVRPDGISTDEVIFDDIVDIRRRVNGGAQGDSLSTSFDKLLNNKLRTKVTRSPDNGSQAGPTHLVSDTYNTVQDLTSLVGGSISSEATKEETFVGPADGTGLLAETDGTLPTEADLTFTVFPNSLYQHNPALYSAVYSGTGDSSIDGAEIPGGFTGLGTDTAKFVLGETGVANGADNAGLRYIIAGERVDYSNPGLSSIPDSPLSVRNSETSSVTESVYYYSIDKDESSKKIKEFDGDLAAYRDYVEVIPGSRTTSDTQEAKSSLVLMHKYMTVSETTNILRIPKDINNFTVYAVSSVVNVTDSTNYRINHIRDREIPSGESSVNTSNIIVYLEETFKIASGDIVEVTLEVNQASTGNTNLDNTILGIVGSDKGESLDSQSNSLVSTMDPGVKGADSFYKSVLVEVSNIASTNGITVTAPNGAEIAGVSTYSTLDSTESSYCWYIKQDELTNMLSNLTTSSNYLKTVKVDSISGIGTSSITISLESGLVTGSTIMVPLLIRETAFPNSLETSQAQVFYRTTVNQTVDGLPSTLELEILENPKLMYLSNLGTGGGLEGEPYSNPLKDIAVNDDTVTAENFYYNVNGLDLSSFSVEGGFVSLPLRVFRNVGESMTLSSPNNDKLGRSFYQNSDEKLVYTAEGMSLGNPRKIFVPMLARVQSDITSPFVRGETVMVVVSKSLNTETTNEIRVGSDTTDTAVGVYRVPGLPLTRS